mmetsp:Transcript_2104/g.2518  ORF Transcript_2104/g.2518 Transcript_2104/m.2518 type:complete len:201 (-) Transcript_2104:173-775(-)
MNKMLYHTRVSFCHCFCVFFTWNLYRATFLVALFLLLPTGTTYCLLKIASRYLETCICIHISHVTCYLPRRNIHFAATAIRCLSSLNAKEGANVIVPLVTDSLEWTLSSPPPLHQFEEPPLMVEVEHLDLVPGAEVEDVLEAQGEKITDIVGKEAWVDNDPALYDGLIPQNEEWTEFIDEKTGEMVYMDEYGQRLEKPAA